MCISRSVGFPCSWDWDRLREAPPEQAGARQRMAWDPATYLRFSDERLRPGFDLLARVGELPPGPLAELGCGTGVHGRAIAERWPERALTALDSSPEMLA